MCDSFGLELRSNSEGLNPESPSTLHPHTVWSDISHGLSRCEGKGKSRRGEEEGKREELLGRVNTVKLSQPSLKLNTAVKTQTFLTGAVSFQKRSTFFGHETIFTGHTFIRNYDIPCIVWEWRDVGRWLDCWDATWKSWFMEVKVFVKRTQMLQKNYKNVIWPSVTRRDILCFQCCFCWNLPASDCLSHRCAGTNRQVNSRVSVQMASFSGWSRQFEHNALSGEGLHVLSNRNFFLSTPWCRLMLSGHPIALLIRREDTKINVPRSS